MLDEVKAAIRKGQETGKAAVTLTHSAARVGEDGGTVAREVTEGVRHEFVQEAFGHLKEALHEVELVLRRLNASDELAEKYLGKLG